MPNVMAALPNMGGTLKVSLTPTTRVPCSNAAKTRNPLKFAAVPQTRQRISVASERPHYEDTWGRYCCLIFLIVNTCLSYEGRARQICAMVRRWRIFGYFLRPAFQRAPRSTFQTCILNLH